MKVKRSYINQILTVMMLWVFSLAITPWSALHHHGDVHVDQVEENCTHKLHIKTSQENCLVCKAHFEKNYTINEQLPIAHLESVQVRRVVLATSSAYTAVISTSLRGPPVIS